MRNEVVEPGRFGREKKISPTNQVMAKNGLAQSIVNNMSSSLQSSSNIPCEEDVISNYVELEKPNMFIHLPVTYGLGGV